jgi:hypothetical protein
MVIAKIRLGQQYHTIGFHDSQDKVRHYGEYRLPRYRERGYNWYTKGQLPIFNLPNPPKLHWRSSSAGNECVRRVWVLPKATGRRRYLRLLLAVTVHPDSKHLTSTVGFYILNVRLTALENESDDGLDSSVYVPSPSSVSC